MVTSPWERKFYEIMGRSRSDLLLVSPFIKSGQIGEVLNRLGESDVLSTIRASIVTDLKPDNILTGSLDVESLLAFTETIPNSKVTYLPNLHAKVYVADNHTAVVTSANLTAGGLANNFEYGVILNDPEVVTFIRRDLDQYASLGAVVSRQTLESMANIADDLRVLRRKAESSIRQKFRVAFEEKLKIANQELLFTRAEGKTTHKIFAETILYLLDRGPLRTADMHPLIQQFHPDLCDDSEDRVIKGVHFGKKWKHYVRTAQVYLRRRGLIHTDGTYWRKTQV